MINEPKQAEIPESVMKAPGRLGDSVMTQIDASGATRFGLHQTRILYGHIHDDVFVLEPQGMLPKINHSSIFSCENRHNTTL